MQLATLKTSYKIKTLSDANPHKGNVRKLVRPSLLKTKIQNSFVADYFWVDASDVGQQPGQFVWQSDGTKVDEAFWRIGQPNDFGAGEETCVNLWTGNGELFDFRCSRLDISFICELAEKDLPC